MSTEKTIHVSDLKLPDGVEANYGEGADPVIATATIKASAEVEEEPVEAAEGEDGEADAPAADGDATPDDDKKD